MLGSFEQLEEWDLSEISNSSGAFYCFPWDQVSLESFTEQLRTNTCVIELFW